MPSIQGDPAESLPRGVERFRLAVDDAGEFLVCTGVEHVIGHARGHRADLPVLADVGPAHARLLRRESFGSGSQWQVAPLGAERVLWNGAPVSTFAALSHGDVLALGANFELRFEAPDPASSTALLALLHGVECLGASRVVLLGEGLGGRLRLGASAARHVRVPDLVEGAELVLVSGAIVVRSELGIAAAGGPPQRSLRLPFPFQERVDLLIGAAGAGRRPLGLALAPISPPIAPREGS